MAAPATEAASEAPAAATAGAGAPAAAAGAGGERKLTAKELRMIEREAAAAAKKAAEATRNAGVFGDAPLVQSQIITGRTWTR